MTLSTKADKIHGEINDQTKLGDLRKIAKEINKDHGLAVELWSAGKFRLRLLAILIMDNKQLTADVVERLFSDIQSHAYDERLQLADWLMANQLTKNKKSSSLMESWEHSQSAIQRRIFWYYQGRLRWVGQKPPDNTKELLAAIEGRMLNEEPEVQWAMNFTAGWIGVFDPAYRSQCIRIGERLGLYKDQVVAKGCTPDYLPAFIATEVKKRNVK